MTTPAVNVEVQADRTLKVTAIGILLCFVNASTLNVALPVVARDMQASPLQATWILLIYMLVTCVLILIFGRVGDLLGRRKIYLLGLTLLTGASVGCAISGNIETLLVMRALQAVGAAAVITNTSALIADVFPNHRLAAGLGTIATISAVAQGLGPLLGSALVEWLGWRMLFWLNLPLGLMGIFAASRVLKSAVSQHGQKFDYLGSLFSILAVGGWVYALSVGGSKGWTDVEVVTSALVGSIAGFAFLISQKLLVSPLVDLQIFNNRKRVGAYVSIFFVCMAQTASIVLVALFLQAVQGLNSAAAGLRVVPLAVGMAIGSALSVRWLRSLSTDVVGGLGSAICAIGLGVLASTLALDSSSLIIGGSLLIIGFGLGTFIPPNTAAIMQVVPSHQRGIANGIRSTAMNLGFLLGAACSLTFATMELQPVAQRAAFLGELGRLSAGEVDIFIDGCVQVFIGLAAICAVTAALMLGGRKI